MPSILGSRCSWPEAVFVASSRLGSCHFCLCRHLGWVVRAWSGHDDAVHFVQMLHVVACVGVGVGSVFAVGQVHMVMDVCVVFCHCLLASAFC